MMAIGQQPTDPTNTHRETDGVSTTPAVGTDPERGVQQHHWRANTPSSITLTGAYHGEGRAIEKCTQKGKYAPKSRKNDCQRNHGEGHEVTGPSAPSKGTPLQQVGLFAR
jgi:hypothetical protein